MLSYMKRVELPPLPYAYDALEPVISRRIMELHHDKHHAGYVKGANAAMEKIEAFLEGDESINIRSVMREYSFHMNGHILHSIFWPNMRPPSDDEPGGELRDAIERSFGSFAAFKKLFTKVALSVEGVGWAVTYTDGKDLYVGYVEKHNLYHIAGYTPVLVLDVWEHAYYLQYENRRGEYVDRWWSVVNWDDVERRYLSVR